MEELPDTQNENDTRKILIDRVGVRELKYPACYLDEHGEIFHTIAKYEMTVELPVHLKGTHMSRFIEAIHDFSSPLSESSLQELTYDLAKRLHAKRAHVSCEFVIFREKIAPVSGMRSKLDYEMGYESRFCEEAGHTTFLSIQIPVATLCPCSKAISERGAHNQRGMVTISLETQESFSVWQLIELAESSASCELYSGLKRVDEKVVTERAYDQPVFVEDLVRNVAFGLKSSPQVSWFRVEAENFESIHNHNAYALIES